MRALAVDGFGLPPALVELPVPVPTPDELLVRMTYSSVNPVDRAAASGALEGLTAAKLPLILGFDGVGEIAAVGGEVQEFSVGDVVHGQFWGEFLGQGTHAEYLTITSMPSFGAVQVVPDEMDLRTAAALPTAGMTADGALERLGLRAGQTVLIIGASGGVGLPAVQLAVRQGLSVVATARAEAADTVREFGAGQTIDYSVQPVEDSLAGTHPAGIDGILDLVGDAAGLSRAADHVRAGGRIVSIAHGVSTDLASRGGVTAVNYVLDQKPARLRRVSLLAARGKLIVPITSEVPLAEAGSALSLSQRGGARGKTVIQIADPTR